jgi:hypothetical protein
MQADGYRIRLGGLVETRDIIRRSRRVMFVACGTSYHACLAARQTVSYTCNPANCLLCLPLRQFLQVLMLPAQRTFLLPWNKTPCCRQFDKLVMCAG